MDLLFYLTILFFFILFDTFYTLLKELNSNFRVGDRVRGLRRGRRDVEIVGIPCECRAENRDEIVRGRGYRKRDSVVICMALMRLHARGVPSISRHRSRIVPEIQSRHHRLASQPASQRASIESWNRSARMAFMHCRRVERVTVSFKIGVPLT